MFDVAGALFAIKLQTKTSRQTMSSRKYSSKRLYIVILQVEIQCLAEAYLRLF